ncbi:MAG: hypothetical protein AB8I08_17185 [Sandaracinaceae bacterium]
MSRPTRSSHGLTPCPTCRRHVVAAERPSQTSCPFCATSKVRGRGSLLAASILALGLTACGGADDGPPPDDAQTEETGGGESTPPENADNSGDAPPDDSPPDDDRYDEGDENRAVALYGVAPE